MIYPASYELTDVINGDLADKFVENYIEKSQNSYEVDSKDGIVKKVFEDGLFEPYDMPSYALHHLNRLRKTNSVTDETKIVFADLTSEEIASTFVLSLDPTGRE